MNLHRSQQIRSMPTLAKIVEYWAIDSRTDVFVNRSTFAFGLREPVCFRCGWLAPLPDMHDKCFAGKDPWRYATGWLERAHLAERFSGGPDRVDNLVPLCNICHRQMPELLDSRDAAITWINAWDPDSRNPFWQLATDKTWAGERYTPFPGTKALLSLRLEIDDFHRCALIEAKRFAASAA